MSQPRSPVTEAAAVTPTLVSAYTSFTQKRIEELQAAVAGYTNSSPQGAIVHSLGRVLASASYIPATPARYKVGRSGKTAEFIILARVAAAGASPGLGSIVSVLTEFANLNVQQVAPHLVVGYGGELVQMVDMDDTAVFLNTSADQPQPLSHARIEDAVVDSVIEFTVANEAGAAGYAAWNPNDGRHGGIAWGFIQFNQRRGTFDQLMLRMSELNPVKFKDIFGSLAPVLLGPDVRLADLSGYRNQFDAAALVPEFQQAQRELARSIYWGATTQAASTMGVASQRAYALLFDAAVQRGPEFIAAAARRATGSTSQKLNFFAVAADTLEKDFSTHVVDEHGRLVDYQRRQRLLTDTRLSDVSLETAEPPARTADQVSDETAIVIMLEGRAGDPLTAKQRDSAAAAIRAVCDELGIPVATSRIFGLDAVVSGSNNPGSSFSLVDLLSAVAAQPKSDPGTRLSKAQPPSASAVATASTALLQSLQKVRSSSNLQTMAVLQAYDGVKAVSRAANLSTHTRATHFNAAVQQRENQQKVAAATAAGVSQSEQASSQDIAGPSRESLRGLLYDYSTGLWSDGKSCGKIQSS